MIYHHSYVLNLSSEKIKFQAWTGFEPMTSAVPVQRSNQLSYQANRELVTCELVIYTWSDQLPHFF